MRYILSALDRRRVWKGIPHYPVYSPPFRDAEKVLARRELEANYEYFLSQKAKRIEYLDSYLASFSTILRLDCFGARSLDDWMFRYGGHLLPWRRRTNAEFVVPALNDYEPAWTGPFQGLNIINDIGIFLGECLIARCPGCQWDMCYGDGTKRDYEKISFGKPCLYGLRHLPPGEPYPILGIAEAYQYCSAGWERLHGESELFWAKGELVRRLDVIAEKHASS